MSMWEPFTESARHSIVLAQEEAQRRGDSYIAPEHMLLGMLRQPEDVAASVLIKHGLTAEFALAQMEPRQGGGAVGEMVFTPRAKQTIELAFEAARRYGHTYMGTEHLVCGLLRVKDPTVSAIFHAAKIPLESIEAEIRAAEEENPHRAAGAGDPAVSLKQQIGALEATLRVYSERGDVWDAIRPNLSQLYMQIRHIARSEGWEL